MVDDALQRFEVECRGSGVARHWLRELLEGLDQQLIDVLRAVAGCVLTRRCTELEGSGYLVLATQSPVATDLRRVIAVLRSVKDIERTGNLLGHVVSSLSWVHPPSLDGELRATIRQFGDGLARVDRPLLRARR